MIALWIVGLIVVAGLTVGLYRSNKFSPLGLMDYFIIGLLTTRFGVRFRAKVVKNVWNASVVIGDAEVAKGEDDYRAWRACWDAVRNLRLKNDHV